MPVTFAIKKKDFLNLTTEPLILPILSFQTSNPLFFCWPLGSSQEALQLHTPAVFSSNALRRNPMQEMEWNPDLREPNVHAHSKASCLEAEASLGSISLVMMAECKSWMGVGSGQLSPMMFTSNEVTHQDSTFPLDHNLSMEAIANFWEYHMVVISQMKS